ncbi:unnamed protein product [Oikopleura dioica]|uniref:Fungal lipase-type domain-containing protein n=1 Tax=Oikopleura dioica TaxID=34765 RepID=E4X161_OIKDI|nr:unnamed protein product [Oikopleura dioica]
MTEPLDLADESLEDKEIEEITEKEEEELLREENGHSTGTSTEPTNILALTTQSQNVVTARLPGTYKGHAAAEKPKKIVNLEPGRPEVILRERSISPGRPKVTGRPKTPEKEDPKKKRKASESDMPEKPNVLRGRARRKTKSRSKERQRNKSRSRSRNRKRSRSRERRRRTRSRSRHKILFQLSELKRNKPKSSSVFTSTLILRCQRCREYLGRYPLKWEQRKILQTPIDTILEWVLAARCSRLAYIPHQEFNRIVDECGDFQSSSCNLTQKSKRKGGQIKAILYQFEKRTFEYINDEKADTDVYIFCNKHYLVIAFRGTAFTMVDGFSFKDVMQDLKDSLAIYCFQNKKNYVDTLKAVREKLFTKTLFNLAEYNPPKILITGHSLGGALASLCAVDLSFSLDEVFTKRIRCITLGAAKTGDSTFCRVFRKNVKNAHRLVLPFDPIPRIPPNIPGMQYKHAIKKTVLKNYKSKMLRAIPTESHHYENYLESLEQTKEQVYKFRFRNAVRKLNKIKKLNRENCPL